VIELNFIYIQEKYLSAVKLKWRHILGGKNGGKLAICLIFSECMTVLLVVFGQVYSYTNVILIHYLKYSRGL